MPATYDIGGSDDSIKLRIGDSEIRHIVESYEVKISILQVPSAFALRIGSADTAIDLWNLAKPGTPFELSVAGRRLMAGRIDARSVPSAQNTTVEIRGRDYLAVLFDAYVAEDQSFTQANYQALTRKVMDIAGLTEAKGHYLEASNIAARRFLTGTQLHANLESELDAELPTGALSGTGNLVFQTPKTKVGERYYDFLVRMYKLAGLFLWATPDKTFVLAAPIAQQAPSFYIYRARGNAGVADEVSNVLDCRFNDDTTMRHSVARVYGRSGGGKHGIDTCSGEFADKEISDYGIDKPIVVHDTDVKNKDQCEFVARRLISEERRAGWQLEYTVAGHTIYSPVADEQLGTWGPDVTVQVDDEEIGVQGVYYLEACTYSRSSSGTTTKLTLMRTSDLLFASGRDGTGSGTVVRKFRRPPGKTVR